MRRPELSVTDGLRWRWSYAARGALTGAPAAATALWDVQLSAALAVGLLPVCALPLAPRRRGRLRSGAIGLAAALSIVVGGFLAQWPVLAVAGMAAIGAVLGRTIATRGRPLEMLGLTLCLPLVAVGFSYPGVEDVAGLAAAIVLGTLWSVAVALVWPAHAQPGPTATTVAEMPPPDVLITYGWVAGLAGAVCAAVGFLADLEHVGWAPAAALLVMRPSTPTQKLRSVDRLADVALGAGAAIVLVLASPPDWGYAAAVLAVVTAATATVGSRWYVLPTFTTYLVFLLLLVGNPADAHHRFWERLLETGLGVGVAALASFVVIPAVSARATRTADHH